MFKNIKEFSSKYKCVQCGCNLQHEFLFSNYLTPLTYMPPNHPLITLGFKPDDKFHLYKSENIDNLMNLSHRSSPWNASWTEVLSVDIESNLNKLDVKKAFAHLTRDNFSNSIKPSVVLYCNNEECLKKFTYAIFSDKLFLDIKNNKIYDLRIFSQEVRIPLNDNFYYILSNSISNKTIIQYKPSMSGWSVGKLGKKTKLLNSNLPYLDISKYTYDKLLFKLQTIITLG